MKVKESEKVGSKLNIQKTKIMASGTITSCQIHGKTTETVTDFIFLGSKITAHISQLIFGKLYPQLPTSEPLPAGICKRSSKCRT